MRAVRDDLLGLVHSLMYLGCCLFANGAMARSHDASLRRLREQAALREASVPLRRAA